MSTRFRLLVGFILFGCCFFSNCEKSTCPEGSVAIRDEEGFVMDSVPLFVNRPH